MRQKILFQNKWLRVREIQHQLPDGETQPYTSVLDGTGKSVAVLPYRRVDGNLEFLLRREIVPPWLIGSEEESCVTLITGGVERIGDSEYMEYPYRAAMREVWEESGYEVIHADLSFLGKVRLSKASEDLVYLYAVDLKDRDPTQEPGGDGSAFEQHAEVFWSPSIDDCEDALGWTILAKLQQRWGRQ